MVIKAIKEEKISEKEACNVLMKKPQQLWIYNIGDVKPSKRREDQYYCFIDYKLDDDRIFGISYSFYLNNNGEFQCNTSSKLYNLMKGFLNLNPFSTVALTFDENDINETLLDKVFIASVKIESVGSKNYLYITCDKVIG